MNKKTKIRKMLMKVLEKLESKMKMKLIKDKIVKNKTMEIITKNKI